MDTQFICAEMNNKILNRNFSWQKINKACFSNSTFEEFLIPLVIASKLTSKKYSKDKQKKF